MKNMNIFLTNLNVVDLNSTEMNEIVGGSWLSRALSNIAEAIIVAVADVFNIEVEYVNE